MIKYHKNSKKYHTPTLPTLSINFYNTIYNLLSFSTLSLLSLYSPSSHANFISLTLHCMSVNLLFSYNFVSVINAFSPRISSFIVSSPVHQSCYDSCDSFYIPCFSDWVSWSMKVIALRLFYKWDLWLFVMIYVALRIVCCTICLLFYETKV